MRTAKCSQPEKLRRCLWSVLQWSLLMLFWCSSENPLTFFLRFTSCSTFEGSAPTESADVLDTILPKIWCHFKIHATDVHFQFWNQVIWSCLDYMITWFFATLLASLVTVFDDIEGSFGDLDTLVLWDGRHFLSAYVDMISRDRCRTSNALGSVFSWQPQFC